MSMNYIILSDFFYSCYQTGVYYMSNVYTVTTYSYQVYAYDCGLFWWNTCYIYRFVIVHILVPQHEDLYYIHYRQVSSQNWAYAQVAVYYQQSTCCPLYSGTYPNCIGMTLMTKYVKILCKTQQLALKDVHMVHVDHQILAIVIMDGLEVVVTQVSIKQLVLQNQNQHLIIFGTQPE